MVIYISKNPMKHFRYLMTSSVAVVVLSATAARASEDRQAPAQGAATSVNSNSTGEIIVTAQRKSERLQEVPIAVTAVSPARLEQLSLRSIDTVTTVTPSFVFGTAYGYSQSFIRGVGSSFPSPGLEGSIATYIDGAYLSRNIGAVFDLLDVQNVQILKGPQGTLYGRNATGGAIVVNTAAPTDRLEGYTLGEYGRFNHILGEGMINLPVNDTLSVRFAGRYTQEDGYIHNLTLNRVMPDRRAHVIRGSMAWRPSSNFSAVLTVEQSRDRSEAFPQAARIGAPQCLGCAISGEGPVMGFYDARNDPHPDSLAKAFSTTLRLRGKVGIFDIDSVTAYRNLTNDSTTDIDATSVNLFNAVSFLGGKTYSQDLVVSSNSGSWLDGIVGVSFVRDNAFQSSQAAGLLFAAIPGSPPTIYNKVDTDSVAGFAQVTVKPAPKLAITLGGRYSHDHRDLLARENLAANLAFVGGTGVLTFNQHAAFDSFTPKAVIAYDAGNVNLYASYNRGFKAGGFSLPLYAPDKPVQPEKLDSFEVGAKFVSSDRKLAVNLAAFYYKQKDLQVRVADLAAGGAAVRNAASATGKGVEVDFDYTPVKGVKLYGGGSYLRARFNDFKNATVNSVVDGALVTTTEDLSGTRVPNAPKFTGFLGTSIEQPIGGDWIVSLNGVIRHSSGYDFFPGAGGNLRLDKQDSYTVVNASGYVGPMGGAYQIGFYVNNLLNEKYSINWQTSAPFGSAQIVAKPRTYGVRLKYSF